MVLPKFVTDGTGMQNVTAKKLCNKRFFLPNGKQILTVTHLVPYVDANLFRFTDPVYTISAIPLIGGGTPTSNELNYMYLSGYGQKKRPFLPIRWMAAHNMRELEEAPSFGWLTGSRFQAVTILPQKWNTWDASLSRPLWLTITP